MENNSGNTAESHCLQLEWDYGEEWPSGKKWSALSRNGLKHAARSDKRHDDRIRKYSHFVGAADVNKGKRTKLKVGSNKRPVDTRDFIEKIKEIALNCCYRKITSSDRKQILKQITSEIIHSRANVSQFIYPLQLIGESSESSFSYPIAKVAYTKDIKREIKNPRFIICHGREQPNHTFNTVENIPEVREVQSQLESPGIAQATVIVLVPRLDTMTTPKDTQEAVHIIPASCLHSARTIPLGLPFSRTRSPSSKKTSKKELSGMPYSANNCLLLNSVYRNDTEFMSPQTSLKRSDITSTLQASTVEYYSAADRYPCAVNDWCSVSNADSFRDETETTDYLSVCSWDTVVESGEWHANTSHTSHFRGHHGIPRILIPVVDDENMLVERPASMLSFVSVHSDELDLHVFGPQQINPKPKMQPSSIVEKCERWLNNTPDILTPQIAENTKQTEFQWHFPLDSENTPGKRMPMSLQPQAPSTARDTHSQTTSGQTSGQSQRNVTHFNEEIGFELPHLNTYTLKVLMEHGDTEIMHNLPIKQNSLIIIPDLDHSAPQTGHFSIANNRSEDVKCSRCVYSCHEIPCHYEELKTPRYKASANCMPQHTGSDKSILVSFPDDNSHTYKLVPANIQCDDAMKKAVQKLLLTECVSGIPNPRFTNVSESMEVILHRTESSENEIRAICRDPEFITSATALTSATTSNSDVLKPFPVKTKINMPDSVRIIKSLDSARSTLMDDVQNQVSLAEPINFMLTQPLNKSELNEELAAGHSTFKPNDSMLTMAGSLLEITTTTEEQTAGGNADHSTLPFLPAADKVTSTHSGPFSSPEQHQYTPVVSLDNSIAVNSDHIYQPECICCTDNITRKSAGAQVKIPSPKLSVDCCCQTNALLVTKNSPKMCTCAQSCSYSLSCNCVHRCTCSCWQRNLPNKSVNSSCQTSARRISPRLEFSCDHEDVSKTEFKSCDQLSRHSSEECFNETNDEDHYHDASDMSNGSGYNHPLPFRIENICGRLNSNSDSQMQQKQPEDGVFDPRVPLPITDDASQFCQPYQRAGQQPYPEPPYQPWNGMYYSPIALQLPANFIAALTSSQQKDTTTACQTTQTTQLSSRSTCRESTPPHTENILDANLTNLSQHQKQDKPHQCNVEAVKFRDELLQNIGKKDNRFMFLSMNVQKGGEWSVVKNTTIEEKAVNQPTPIQRPEPQAVVLPQVSVVGALSPRWVDEYDKVQQHTKSASAMISRGNQCDEECLRSMADPSSNGAKEVKLDSQVPTTNSEQAAVTNSGKRDRTPVLRLVFASSDESDVGERTYYIKSCKHKKRNNYKHESASSNYVTVEERSPARLDQRDEFLQMLLKLYKELSMKSLPKCDCVHTSSTDTSVANYRFQTESKGRTDSLRPSQIRQSSGGDWKETKSHYKNSHFREKVCCHKKTAGRDNLFTKPCATTAEQNEIVIINRSLQVQKPRLMTEVSPGPNIAPQPLHRAKVWPRQSSSWGGLETLLDRLTPIKKTDDLNGDGTFRPKTVPTRPRCCYTGNNNICGNSRHGKRGGCDQSCGERYAGFMTESTNTATSDISFYCQKSFQVTEAAGDENIFCYGKKHRSDKQKMHNLRH